MSAARSNDPSFFADNWSLIGPDRPVEGGPDDSQSADVKVALLDWHEGLNVLASEQQVESTRSEPPHW